MIVVNEDWRIGADKLQFIIVKRNSKGNWLNVAYFTDLMQAAMYIVNQHLKAATSPN